MRYVVYFVLLFFSVSLNSQTVWVQTNGPYSGHLSYITKNGQGHLFAISENYYLFRSKDSGANWAKIASKISSIAFDSDNNYYLGTTSGEVSLFDTNMNFIKTTRKPNFMDMHVESIDIDANENIYVEVFFGGLHLSTDKGISWVDIFANNFQQLSFDSNSVVIMTFGGKSINRSINMGTDWTIIQISDDSYLRGIYFSSYNKIFNNFIAVGRGNIVYISNDLGLTWLPMEDSIPINWVEAVLIDENGDAYIGGDSLVCRSTDGGYTWTKLDGFPKVRGQSLVKQGDMIFTATWSNGVVAYDISKNSGEKKNNGIINSNVHQIAINQKANVFASTASGIYRTTNSGNYWEQLELPISSDVESTAILASKSGNLFASSEHGVLISKDDGQSWSIVDNMETYPEITTCFAESDDGRIYAGNHYLHYSDDKGESWQSIDLKIDEIASIATYQNKYVLVGSANDGVFFSEDKSISFRKLPLDVPENTQNHVNFNSEGIIFISMNAWQGGDAVFRSMDFGNTFTTLDSPNGGVRFLKIDNNDILYYSPNHRIIHSFGKYNLIYYSTNNGDIWLPLNDESIYPIFIKNMAFGKNNNAYIGTLNDGVYKTDFLANVNSELIQNPVDFSIFPNPATEYIEISSHTINPTVNRRVDEGSEIKIYNTLGECVRNLTPPAHPSTGSGSGNLRVDISHLPRGVYYLRIGSRTRMFVKM
ncbi:MAG: T9SS type A sorting domain-containing protein [Candidatus Kapabacteria bacterium]|nr:T9SS type A sorting domain-containing protein [Candidatus Kapabacteria bacterium]